MRADAGSAELRRFGAFALTGALAAAVNVAARFALSLVLTYESAVAVAYLVGMTTAFLLTRRFVFAPSGGSWHGEYLRFGGVNVVAFVQVWVVSVALYRFLFPAIGFSWHAEEVAHVIGVSSPIITSYYAHKHFSFRPAAGSGDAGRKP